MRITCCALAAALLAAGVANAKPCRDAKGHFTACPTPVAAQAQRCRDAKGAFAKCSAPGARPVAVSHTVSTSKTTIKAH